MLGKLLKHEWKSIWKIPIILIGVLLAIAFLAGLTFMAPLWSRDLFGQEILIFMLWMLFYFAIIGVSIGITLYLAIHFYKSMFTDEGYLTHTLPVSSHQLLISKILPMMAWTVISMLGILVSIGIFGGMAFAFLLPDEVTWSEFYRAMAELIAEIGLSAGEWAELITSIVFLGLAGIINGAMIIVGSISIGQLVSKHKVLGSIGAYFAIQTVTQMLSGVIFMPVMISKIETSSTVIDVLTPAYFIMGGIALLVAVGLYFLSEFLIRRKLNLD